MTSAGNGVIPLPAWGGHVAAAACSEGLPAGHAQCLSCSALIQRTSSGSLADGVRAHYRTVHPTKGVQ